MIRLGLPLLPTVDKAPTNQQCSVDKAPGALWHLSVDAGRGVLGCPRPEFLEILLDRSFQRCPQRSYASHKQYFLISLFCRSR